MNEQNTQNQVEVETEFGDLNSDLIKLIREIDNQIQSAYESKK